MTEEDCASWEEFESRLGQLTGERDQTVKSAAPIHVSSLLFRGQASAQWKLQTTLERRGRQPWTAARYFRLVSIARPQVETFTNKQWEAVSFNEFTEWANTYDNFFKPIPAYDYLVYLRHHGFPSPFLDWTRSPYVAAYFALAQPESDRVAIFAYMEYAGGGKGGSSDRPQIMSLGPYVRSHSRHFLQQSEYTFAAKFDHQWIFVSHEDVFAQTGEEQDRLWKFTIPSSERTKVLKNLEAYNLNAFSLFQTEESLLEAIAVREIELSERSD